MNNENISKMQSLVILMQYLMVLDYFTKCIQYFSPTTFRSGLGFTSNSDGYDISRKEILLNCCEISLLIEILTNIVFIL
jgi:hypothetical protein